MLTNNDDIRCWKKLIGRPIFCSFEFQFPKILIAKYLVIEWGGYVQNHKNGKRNIYCLLQYKRGGGCDGGVVSEGETVLVDL